MPVEITPEAQRKMEEDGFFVLERVFTPDEMEEIAAIVTDYSDRHRERIRASGGTEGISRSDEIAFTSHLAENDPRLRAFATRPEFVEIATAFLGPDVDLYWNQSVIKLPETAREFPWHQDDGYTPVTPSPYLTLWLALNDATEQNGCISALPGSHRRGLLPHEPSPVGLTCHPLDHPDQGVRVPVAQGGLAVFWSLTAHKSGPNLSDGPRKAYILQYSKAGLRNARTGEPIENRIPLARGGVAAG